MLNFWMATFRPRQSYDICNQTAAIDIRVWYTSSIILYINWYVDAQAISSFTLCLCRRALKIRRGEGKIRTWSESLLINYWSYTNMNHYWTSRPLVDPMIEYQGFHHPPPLDRWLTGLKMVQVTNSVGCEGFSSSGGGSMTKRCW